MVNSCCVLETVSLTGERRVLGFWRTPCGRCKASKPRHQAEGLRLFSKGRRAHTGVSPSH